MSAKVYLSKSGYCRNDDLIRVREYILDSGAELVEHQGKPYNEQKAIEDNFDVNDAFLWITKESIKRDHRIHDENDWKFKHYAFIIASAKKVAVDTLKMVMAGYNTKYPSDDYINEKKIYKEVDIKIDRIFGDFFKRKH